MPKTKAIALSVAALREAPVVMIHDPLCRKLDRRTVLSRAIGHGTEWETQGGRCFVCGQKLELAVWQYVTITASATTATALAGATKTGAN